MPHFYVCRIVDEGSAIYRIGRVKYITHGGIVYYNGLTHVAIEQFQIFHVMTVVKDAIFTEKSFLDDLVDVEFVE